MTPPDAKRRPADGRDGAPKITGQEIDTPSVDAPATTPACLMSCSAHRCPFVCLYLGGES